jgi:abortive infection bacteriophage resistance protein
MKFTKAALSVEQQADLLISRGMQGDRDEMLKRLGFVNYYRLSGYWFTDRIPPTDNFRPGTNFGEVWQLYVVDRKLRLLVMDAVERIEVAARTLLARAHALRHGPFGYVDDHNAMDRRARTPQHEHQRQIRDEVRRNADEQFVAHFMSKYGAEHPDLPIWMATEVMSFGTVARLLSDSSPAIRSEVAAAFAVPDEVVVSWLRTLSFVRNVCAHHGRLWNRVLAYQMKLPRGSKYREWELPVPIGRDRVFGVLTVCRHCLRQFAPGSSWGVRVRGLLNEYPAVSRRAMGFPTDWQRSPLWSEKDP